MEWFSSSELIGLPTLPKTVQGINYKAKIESWESRPRAGHGGGKEYHISSFSPAVQAALYCRQGKVQVGETVLELPKKNESSLTYCREALWSNWEKTNETARNKATQALKTVNAVEALIQNGVARMDAYKSVSELYGVALSTLRRNCSKVKGIEQCDWAPTLLPKHFEAAQAQKSERFAFITPEAWEFFKTDYLRLSKPSMSVCYLRLTRAASEHGWVIPSEKSLRRRMAFEVPRTQQVLLRQGEHALHQMYPPQERTVEQLHALEWINGDGYQHNVFVRWFNGEIIRPKTWFWQDIYSRKIIGWRCDISENTDSIRLSFMDVCEKYGIPKHITIDNTRAAANKWMTGGVPNRYRFKVKPDDPKGIMTMLVGEKNIHWTSVILGKGHGQAKPIERAFGVGGLEELIDKDIRCEGAYTGPNPMAKPDNYGSKAIEAEEFLQIIAEGVEMYNEKEKRQTEICRGFMSFNQAFNASYQSSPIRKATQEQLNMMMLQAEAVRVTVHGTISLTAGGSLRGRKNRYGSDDMMGYVGQKVVARFDPMKLHSSVEVYTLNGVKICTADCIDRSGYGDTQRGREINRARTNFTKHTKAAAKAQLTIDEMEAAALMKPLGEEFIPEAKVVEPFRPVSIGNTAVRQQVEEEPEDDYERNFGESIALLKAKHNKNRL
ncbi:Mu transposase C-terminal domain-containing protein [Vibrio harveyi]|uniref:transposase domain-containing protein n=1 Tax=Vibrio harveyi TaxID=669 RepID=UPI000682DE4A|nr:transposase domain-containing protein [Vibrio harveyi]ELY1986554.1 Mu transposase C-terminal domain-containing protein [Vibrio harveyi]